MKRLLLSLFSMLILSSAFSQTFHKTYDIGASDDYGNYITGTVGALYLAGSTSKAGAGSYDAMLIHIDSTGQPVWQVQFGGPQFEAGRAVTPFRGQFVVAGSSTSTSSSHNTDILLFGVDSAGTFQGAISYGFDSLSEEAADITTIGDSNLVIVGTTQANGDGTHTNMFMIRTDKDAQPVWMKTFGTPGGNTVGLRVVAADGLGILAIGSTSPTSGGIGGNDAYVVHVDFEGNLQDQLLIGRAGYDDGRGFAFNNNSLFITGVTGSISGPNRSNGYITAFNTSSGLTKVWSKNYGGDSSLDLQNIRVDPLDGNLIVAANRAISGFGDQSMLFKVNATDGSVMWAETFGGTGNDYINSMIVADDGSILFAGETSHGGLSDAFAGRTGNDGNFCNAVPYTVEARDNNDSLIGPSLTTHTDSVVNFPYQQASLTSNNYAVTFNNLCLSTGIRTLAQSNGQVNLYPNPTLGLLFVESEGWSNKVKMSIYNTLGAEVFTKTVEPGTQNFNIDLSGNPKGMYIISFNDGTGMITQKITLN